MTDKEPFAQVGDHFIYNADYRWSGPNDKKGVQHFKLVIEVTETTDDRARWKLVEVLEEWGAPPTGAKSAPEKGGFSLRPEAAWYITSNFTKVEEQA